MEFPDSLGQGFANNLLIYQKELDRIARKYSALDGGMEVDMFDVSPRSLRSYMDNSKVDEMEPKDLSELKEKSFRSQDVTKNSQQFDFTESGDSADDTGSILSLAPGSDDDEDKMQSDTNSLRSFDETDQSLTNTELQPESLNEELDMTLRSNSSSIANLYPKMVCRIERAWQRQNTSAASNSVVRRYRRCRQPLRRGALNATLAFRRGKRKPEKMSNRTSPRKSSDSPAVCRSPFQYKTQPQELHPSPSLNIEITGPAETFKPRQVTLNQTFTRPKLTQQPAQPRTNIASPTRSCHLMQTSSWEPSPRSNRHPLPAHSVPAPRYASSAERRNILSSPVRKSPIKAGLMDSPARSPLVICPRTPQGLSPERFSRELMRRRSLSTPSVSPQKSTMPQRMLNQQDLHPSPQPPQLARADLSSDSALPPVITPLSPQKVDEEYLKVYHKYVCLNKSPQFNSHPCRICVKYPEARKLDFSSSISALALSPYHSTLGKRSRDLDHQPQSQCSSDTCCLPSPGSKRHRNEMLRHRLSQSELCDDNLGHSLGKNRKLNEVRTQLDSTDRREETRFRLSQHRSPRRAGHLKARCKLALPTGNGEHGSNQR